MKFFQSFIFLLFFVLVVADGNAQRLKENELVVIKGEKFVLHQTRTGETIYSLTKRFNVDSAELVGYNPEIADGLKIGEILKIPYRDGAELQDKPVFQKGDPSHFVFHTITSRKETPYFIAKQYGITVEELYAYNPEVKRFRRGKKLRIPRWESPADDVAEQIILQEDKAEEQEEELIKHRVKPGETLYSLSQRYKVSESEILFYNPGARNLKAGSVIYLPKKKGVTIDEPDEPTQKPEPEKPESATAATGLGNYFNHTIVSGETMWGITRKYDVSEQELKSINPVLKTGFPAGVTIKIPVNDTELSKAKPKNEDAFIKHQVEKGETLYGLAREYNLTIPEIKQFNPVLENRNLVYGETVLIPRKPDEEILSFMEQKKTLEEKEPESVKDTLASGPPIFESDYYEIEIPREIPENCEPSEFKNYTGSVCNVALFLPLFTLANDTLNREKIVPDSLETDSSNVLDETLAATELNQGNDTIVEEELTKEMFHGFYRNTEDFLQFYEGVLLAVDSMQKAGMKIRLNVFDTQQNRDSIRKFIYSEDFLETDLIIGPVYPSVQQEVSDISAKNRIPMISPLAPQSADLNSNSYLYQVNPSREFLATRTADLIAEEYYNSNFIVFNTGNNQPTAQRVVELAKEKLYQSGYWGQDYGVNFTEYNFDAEGPFGFKRILTHRKENVVFIPTLNEGEVSVALSNINNLSGDHSVTVIGFNRYEQYSSIDQELYFNLKLHYIDPYWIDYSEPVTVDFIQKFKNTFLTEPDNFGFQGYDVTFFFLNALYDYGRNFEDCLPYMQVDLQQGNYRFEKVSPFGGYMNQGVSVIGYQSDFEVVRKRIIGNYRYAQK